MSKIPTATVALAILLTLVGCSTALVEGENNNEVFIVESPTEANSEDLENVQVNTLPLTFPVDVPAISNTYAENSYSVITNEDGSQVWNIIFFAEGKTLENVIDMFTDAGWVINEEAAAETDAIRVFTSDELEMQVIVIPSETFEESSFVYTITQL